jgi:hypothetical protein
VGPLIPQRITETPPQECIFGSTDLTNSYPKKFSKFLVKVFELRQNGDRVNEYSSFLRPQLAQAL